MKPQSFTLLAGGFAIADRAIVLRSGLLLE